MIELGIVMALLLGWQFTLAEFVGGPIMIMLMAVLFRLFLRTRLVEDAREQDRKGVAGAMEGHAAMYMAVRRQDSFWQRLFSRDGYTAVSHVFVMDWAAIVRDIAVGLLLAGAIGVWVPHEFWQAFFFSGDPTLAAVWGPIIGPIVAIASFVCSIGNVPLAAVLWNGGISFGGVIAFIYADLLVLPILGIYRKYYGMRMTLALFGIFYAVIVAAGYAVELLFGATGLVPQHGTAQVMTEDIGWNYTTWLNIAFLALAAVVLTRFFRTGGASMLRMMGGSPDAAASHSHQ